MARRGWRPLLSLREAFRNLLAPSARSAIVVVLVVASAFLLLIGAVQDDDRLLEVLDDQTRLGEHTLVFGSSEPSNPQRISVTSCEALTEQRGVTRAGPIQFVGLDDVAQLGPNVSVMATSRSLVPELGNAAAVVGISLDLDAPGYLHGELLGDVMAVPGTPMPGGIPTETAVAVEMSAAQRWTSQCLAVVDPRYDTQEALTLLGSSLDVENGSLLSHSYVTSQYDAIAAYLDRQGRWFAVIVGAVLAVIGAIGSRFRNSEIAAYRLTGTSRTDMLFILTLEQAILAGVFLLIGTIDVVAIQHELVSPRSHILQMAEAACVWIALYPVLALTSVLQDPVRQAKDR